MKMRLFCCALLLGGLALLPASESEASDLRLGADVGLTLNLDDIGRPNIGGLFRLEYFLNENVPITTRAGFLFGLKKDGAQFHYLPILVGARYYLGAGEGLFFGGETGITMLMASVDTGFGSASSTDAKLSLALTAGYDTGNLQIGGGLFLPSVGDAGTFTNLLFTVGFNF